MTQLSYSARSSAEASPSFTRSASQATRSAAAGVARSSIRARNDASSMHSATGDISESKLIILMASANHTSPALQQPSGSSAGKLRADPNPSEIVAQHHPQCFPRARTAGTALRFITATSISQGSPCPGNPWAEGRNAVGVDRLCPGGAAQIGIEPGPSYPYSLQRLFGPLVELLITSVVPA